MNPSTLIPPTYRQQDPNHPTVDKASCNTSGFMTNNKEFEGRGFIVRRVAPVEDSKNSRLTLVSNRTITEYRRKYNVDNSRLTRTSSLARTQVPA